MIPSFPRGAKVLIFNMVHNVHFVQSFHCSSHHLFIQPFVEPTLDSAPFPFLLKLIPLDAQIHQVDKHQLSPRGLVGRPTHCVTTLLTMITQVALVITHWCCLKIGESPPKRAGFPVASLFGTIQKAETP